MQSGFNVIGSDFIVGDGSMLFEIKVKTWLLGLIGSGSNYVYYDDLFHLLRSVLKLSKKILFEEIFYELTIVIYNMHIITILLVT